MSIGLPATERVRLNGIPLDPLTLDQACEWIFEHAAMSSPLSIVTTVNVQLMRVASTNAAFAHVLEHRSALNLVDGWPIAWLLRLRGVDDAVRTPGSDLTARLLRSSRAADVGVYLLGDMDDTLVAVRDRARSEGWASTLRGADAPSRAAVDADRSSEALVERINASGAGILLVAFGAPRQELWLARWHERLRPRIGIGIGGSLKFVAWPERRAPRWIRDSGLEWLHRLSLEPARLLPRYTLDAAALMRIALSEAMRTHRHPRTPRR
jgi:N-acetylglucosaminyldiphosphoundecaprenol N-acetyl-beta-D-mannosaminyltransferase